MGQKVAIFVSRNRKIVALQTTGGKVFDLKKKSQLLGIKRDLWVKVPRVIVVYTWGHVV